MNETLSHSLQSLTQEIRHYIEQRRAYETPPLFTLLSPHAPPAPVMREKPSTKAPPAPPKEEKNIPAPPSKKELVPASRSLGNWTLNSMAIPDELAPSFTSFPQHPLRIPIYLFVADPEPLPFLESLARALTEFLAPAALFSGKIDSLLVRDYVKLLLAPLSFLRKRWPDVQVHEGFPLDNVTLLPLADSYTPEQKRALWKSLHHFCTTHLSS